MASLTLQLDAGTARDFPLQAQTPDGNPATAFLSSDTLTAKLWPGGAAAVVATPAATWTDVATGTYQVSFDNADTASLDPANYRVQVTATRSGRSVVIGDFTLILSASPGASAPPSVYCSYQDMLNRAPWIGQLQSAVDTAGFVVQRGLARTWFEDLLQRSYRGNGSLAYDFHFVPGISFAGSGDRMASLFRPGVRSAQLQTWLDAGRLDVTAQVIEATACYAVALVAEIQVSPTQAASPYAALGVRFMARAENQASLVTAEIDSDGDGINDVYVRLGIADTLYG